MAPSAIAPVRPRPSNPIDHPRTLGSAVGLIVGAAFALLAEVVHFGARINLDELPWTVPTVLTGAFVGGLFGPAALRAQGARTRLKVAIGQAVMAVIVGALAVGMLGGVEAVVDSGGPGRIVEGLYFGVVLGVYGIVLFGWLIAPIALAAAIIWSAAMQAVARRL